MIESAKKGKLSFGSASNKLDQPHYTVGSYTIVRPLAANKKMQLPENATKAQRDKEKSTIGGNDYKQKVTLFLLWAKQKRT